MPCMKDPMVGAGERQVLVPCWSGLALLAVPVLAGDLQVELLGHDAGRVGAV